MQWASIDETVMAECWGVSGLWLGARTRPSRGIYHARTMRTAISPCGKWREEARAPVRADKDRYAKGNDMAFHHIGKQYIFWLPAHDGCGRRTYVAEVELSADALVGPGWVTDFGDLTPLRRYLLSDEGRVALHKASTETVPTEGITKHLTDWCGTYIAPHIPGRLVALRVWESRESWEDRTRRFTFAAGHHLPSLPADHKCSRPHGHNYTVEVMVPSQFRPDSEVQATLGRFGAFLRQHFDHRDLNDVMSVEPTCEAIASELAHWLDTHAPCEAPGSIAGVRVWESPTSWAECPIGGMCA
jgi:6-pyruvoyltetrahydropterin/6-carboxytetrahydropterin synthase